MRPATQGGTPKRHAARGAMALYVGCTEQKQTMSLLFEWPATGQKKTRRQCIKREQQVVPARGRGPCSIQIGYSESSMLNRGANAVLRCCGVVLFEYVW